MEELETILVVAIPVISTALVVIGFLYFRARTRKDLHDTLRAALEKGDTLSPELLEGLAHSKTGDFRRGIMGVAIAVAFGTVGVVMGEEDAVRPMLGISMFPLFIGIAYLAMWWRGGRS